MKVELCDIFLLEKVETYFMIVKCELISYIFCKIFLCLVL